MSVATTRPFSPTCSASQTAMEPQPIIFVLLAPPRGQSVTGLTARVDVCRTLFWPALQLMSFQALALCSHRDSLLLVVSASTTLRDDTVAKTTALRAIRLSSSHGKAQQPEKGDHCFKAPALRCCSNSIGADRCWRPDDPFFTASAL